jgi:pilus assembly protein CpaE
MLSLTPQHTLADLGRINSALDAGAVESLLTKHSERLSVLAAPVHLGAAVASSSVGSVLQILKGMFDVVVVDTAGAFDDHALQALDHSDLLVLVGTLDIPALKNLKLAVGTLDLLNFPRDLWRLLVNRADPKIGLSIEEVEQTLGISAAATLPSSSEILTAVNRGEPIVRVSPTHDVSKRLATLAAAISRDVALPGRAAAPEPVSHRRSPRRGLRARKAA